MAYKATETDILYGAAIDHTMMAYKGTETDVLFGGLLWGPRSPLLCATLCDIRRHWQFSKKSSVRRWATLSDIERHWATLGDIGQN
jgi:hypothetical protein